MSQCETPLIPIRVERPESARPRPATGHGGCSGQCADCPNRQRGEGARKG